MNQIEQLKALHYKCRDFLDRKDYAGFAQLCNEYVQLYKNIELDGVNELKTIQIASQSLMKHPVVGESMKQVIDLLDDKLSFLGKMKSS